MIISVTERGTFKRCRKMWDYASFNRQGLTSLQQPTALAFGTLAHKVHEEWLLHPSATAETVVAHVAAQGMDALRKQYREIVGVDPDSNELERYLDSVALVRDIFVNYEEHWGASLPDGFSLVKPEQTVLIPIPETDHHLEATFDGLMRDEGGRLWILERKTYNQKPRIDALQWNDQFLGYLWALGQLGMGEVGGILYDGMWKRYRVEVGASGRKTERSLDDLFLRIPLIRSPEEIENFGIQLRDEVLDMASPTLRIYRNARWEGCWDCQFTRLCMAEFRDEDAEYARSTAYVQRTRHEWLSSQNENSETS